MARDQITFSDRQAYQAMYYYFEQVYSNTNSFDLGSLLGGMAIMEDGRTADPAAWSDWENAIKGLSKDSDNAGGKRIHLNEKHAFEAMHNYIEGLTKLIDSDYLREFSAATKPMKDGMPIDSEIWRNWMNSIERTMIDETAWDSDDHDLRFKIL